METNITNAISTEMGRSRLLDDTIVSSMGALHMDICNVLLGISLPRATEALWIVSSMSSWLNCCDRSHLDASMTAMQEPNSDADTNCMHVSPCSLARCMKYNADIHDKTLLSWTRVELATRSHGNPFFEVKFVYAS